MSLSSPEPPSPSYGRNSLGSFMAKSLGLAILIACFAVGGWLAFFKGRDLWKSKRAQTLAEAVEEMAKAEQWDAAMPALTRAYTETPRDPHVLRMIAKFCDRFPSQSQDAAHFWKSLIETGAATAEDRASFAAAALRIGDMETAEKMLGTLSGAELDVRVARETRAGLLDRRGQTKEAMEIWRSVWESQPDDPECQLRLAEADAGSPFQEVRDAAKERLLKTARGGGKLAGPALIAIALNSSLTRDECAESIRMIDTAGEMNERQRITLVDLFVERAQSPEFTMKIVASEIARIKAKQPDDGGGACFEWLVRHGQGAVVLDSLPREAAVKSRDLLAPYAGALMQAGRWQELEKLLAEKDLPFSPVDRKLMAAFQSQGRGEPDENIRLHLRSALTQAAAVKNPSVMQQALNAAASLGKFDIAIEAAEALAAIRQLQLPMLARIYGLRRQMGDVRGMLAAADRILTLRPGLPPYQDHARYLRLISGFDLEAVIHELGKPDAPVPASPLHSLNLALAAWHRGDADGAKARIGDLKPDLLDPGSRAVRAGLLWFLGSRTEAFQAAEHIHESAVFPDEKIFLQAALQ